MLVLSRKVGEKIEIGEDISVVVSDITFINNCARAKIAIEAPPVINIVRPEAKKKFREKSEDDDNIYNR